MTRERGKFSIGGAVVVVLLVAGLYLGFMYLPVGLHKWTMGEVARGAASRMMVEFDDNAIRNKVVDEARRNGLTVGPSEVLLQRDPVARKATVTIKWTEQVKHIWGKNHVIRMQVSEIAAPGDIKIKNAE